MNKKPGIDWKIIKDIRDYLSVNDIRIVHAHNPGTLFYGALSSISFNSRILISTEHGFSNSITLKYRIKERLLYKMVDCVCSVSEKLAEDLSITYRLNSAKTYIVHNGVSSAAILEDKNVSKMRLGMNAKEFNIGIVARLVPVKNHRMLLKALSIVKKKHRNLKLWIVGSGELRNELEEFIRKLKLLDNVSFMGIRNDVHSILNALDAFVLCSYSEGLSVTLLEAMSAGLPIVATAVGGNREAIIDKHSGMLVESDNPRQLADALIFILENPVFAKEMGIKARKRYEKHFSVSRMVSETAAVYRAALNG